MSNSPEETEEEFYKRILKGPNAELDKIVLGLLDKKENLGKWIIENDFDISRFKKVIEEAYEKLFAIDYFSYRIEEFQSPSDERPHQKQRDNIQNLIFYLDSFKPLIVKHQRSKNKNILKAKIANAVRAKAVLERQESIRSHLKNNPIIDPKPYSLEGYLIKTLKLKNSKGKDLSERIITEDLKAIQEKR